MFGIKWAWALSTINWSRRAGPGFREGEGGPYHRSESLVAKKTEF